MRTIGSFKLHKQGQEGIEISSEQLSKSMMENNSEIFYDNVNTYRKNNVPEPIIDAIARLKFYFLSLTGHWIDLYNLYIDDEHRMILPLTNDAKKGHIYLKTLWQKTNVTQVKFTETYIQIMGTIDVVEDKPLSINPPRITLNDDIEWYMEADAKIRAIFKLLVQYFSTMPLNDADDYRRFLVANTKEDQQADIASFDDTQVMNKVLDRLSKSGAVIMMDEEVKQNVLENTVETSKTPEMEYEPEPEAPIEEVMEEVAETPYTPPVEKVKDPFGAPIAEKGQADPVDPSLEFTEKIGDADFEPEDGVQTDEIPDSDFDV